jgi:hypothetical protein
MLNMSNGVDVKHHTFLTYTLDVGEHCVSHILCFTLDTHWVGGWVGPRASLGPLENFNFMLYSVNPNSLTKPLGIEHVNKNIIVKYKNIVDMLRILV